jgi:predicted dehydrogenase
VSNEHIRPVTIAIVGTNWISGEMAEAFRLAGERNAPYQVTAIVSRSQEKGRAFAESIGCPDALIYPTAEALAAQTNRPEAAYIATPNSLHVPQTKALLAAGFHVLCEKPMVLSPQEWEEVHSLAAAENRILMEAIMYLHTPERQVIRQALDTIAPLQSATLEFLQYSSRIEAFYKGSIASVFDPAYGGGARNDLGIYCVYPAADWLGEPLPDTVRARDTLLPNGADGAGEVQMSFTACPEVKLCWSKTRQSDAPSVLRGSNGELRIGHISQVQEVYLTAKAQTGRLDTPRSKAAVMAEEAVAFHRYVAGGEVLVSYAQASALSRKAHQLMQRIREKAL